MHLFLVPVKHASKKVYCYINGKNTVPQLTVFQDDIFILFFFIFFKELVSLNMYYQRS
jgi:hypothetical protein